MALTQRVARGDRARLRARGLQRRREPRRRSPAPASRTTCTCTWCRAGRATPTSCRCVGDTRVLPESLRGHATHAAGGLPRRAVMSDVDPGIFKAYDVRGLYPDQIDEDVAYRVGARLRAGARRAAGRHAGRRACGSRSGTTCACTPPALAEAFARGLVDEGVRRARHRHGRHRDGLLRGRLAGARRRRVGDRLAQPQAVGRLQARARGRARAVRRPAASRTCSASRRAATSRRRAAQGSVERADIYEEFQQLRARLHRAGGDPADEGRARRRQRHGRPDDRPDPRLASRSSGSGSTSSPTASSPGTSRTRCWRRTAS